MRDDPESSPFRSQVPEYIAERFHIHEDEGSYDMLQITCPRPDCGNTFWVAAWWAQKADFGVQTRPCPYCFRVSWKPGLKPTRPEPAPNARRRVVKRRRK